MQNALNGSAKPLAEKDFSYLSQTGKRIDRHAIAFGCLAGLSLAGIALASAEAQAACSTSSPTTGQTVTCSDVDTTGITGGTGVNNVTVNIGTTGSIATTGAVTPLMIRGSDWVVTNSGTMSATSANIIYTGFDAQRVNITNNGTMHSDTSYVLDLNQGGTVTNNLGASITTTVQAIVSSNTLLTVNNYGEISTTGGYAIQAQYGAAVTNYATGEITGNYFGVAMEGGPAPVSRVSNYGTITGTLGWATDMGTGGNVTNYTDALLTGANGVRFRDTSGGTPANAGVLINMGEVLATSGVAAEFQNGGGVYNYEGFITGVTAAIAFSGNVNGTVVNYAEINGDINMGGGDDTIRLYAGSSLDGNIDGGDGTDSITLEANSVDTSTLSSDISNIETLTVDAADTNWIYTGSGTISGGISVQNGKLSVNGTLGGALTVDAGAALGGSGTVGSTIVSGVLAPGNSIDTITVDGTLGFNPTAKYLVELSPTETDLTHVTGAATLDGTLELAPETGSYTVGASYVVLTADGGYTGVFSDFVGADAFGPAVLAMLQYEDDDVVIYLAPSSLTPLVNFDATGNQQNVIDTVNTALGNGNGLTEFTRLFNLPSDALPAALDQLSGEVGAAVSASVTAMLDTGLSLMGSGLRGGYSVDGVACSGTNGERHDGTQCDDHRLSVEAFGNLRYMGGDAATGSHDLSLRTGGILARMDARIGDNTLAGVMMGGFESNYRLSDDLGSGDAVGAFAGAHASHWMGNAYVSAGGLGLWQSGSSDRSITATGMEGDLEADGIDSFGLAGQLEAGYRIALGAGGITPYAGISGTLARTSSYSEDGTGAAAAYELGYDWQAVLDTGAMAYFEARAGWTHDFSTGNEATARFVNIADDKFTVNGAGSAGDALRVSLASSVEIAPSRRIQLGFDGDFSRQTSNYGGRLRYSLAW